MLLGKGRATDSYGWFSHHPSLVTKKGKNNVRGQEEGEKKRPGHFRPQVLRAPWPGSFLYSSGVIFSPSFSSHHCLLHPLCAPLATFLALRERARPASLCPKAQRLLQRRCSTQVPRLPSPPSPRRRRRPSYTLCYLFIRVTESLRPCLASSPPQRQTTAQLHPTKPG